MYPSTPLDWDLFARVVAIEMSRVLGQPIVVDDKPGANQIIALEHVARQSPADGYTVAVEGMDGAALLPLTSKDLRFDPIKDLVPVAGIAESRYVLAGAVARPWKNFNELIAYAKAHPGELNYGWSVHQVRFPVLVLIEKLGLDIVNIPYSGGGPYLQAIAAGTVDFGIAGEGTAAALGPRVRLFAVSGQQRLASQPDVPTFGELGFPQIRGPSYSLSVRAGTAKPIIDKLGGAAATTMQRPEMRGALAKLLLEPTQENAEQAARKQVELAQFYSDFSKKVKMTSE